MYRNRWPWVVLLVFFIGLVGFCIPALSTGGEPQHKPAVRIGIISSLFRDTPEPLFQVMMRPLKSLMESQTGLTPQLLPGGDAGQLGQQLMENKVQLGVFHSFEFAWSRLKHPELKPLMVTVTPGRQLRVYLVVHKDSKIAAFADLKGASLAMPLRSREYCHLFLERRCQECGAQPERFLDSIATPPDSEEALDNVVDGQVKAAIVDKVSLDSYMDRKPGRFAKVKVVKESEAFPPGVIAYRPGVLDESTLDRFRDGMLNASRTERGRQLLTMCGIAGFERVPADYDQMLEDTIRAYPPPGATKSISDE